VGPDEQTTVELAVLAGYDADLADESTRLINRLHDALSHVHPSLERLLGKHFHCPGVLRLLAATGTPAAIGRLGEAGIATVMADGSPRLVRTLPARIVSALTDQSVTIPATDQYGRVIRGLADQLSTVLAQRKTLRGELEELLAAHPLAEVLTSMPGVGPGLPSSCCAPSATGRPFRRRRTSPPTPAWRRSPDSPGAASRANTSPAAATEP
jgi:transposase